MDLKNLLGKLDIIEGTMQGATKHPTGPKFTGKWKGTDAGTPGTKMVGGDEQQESILKDLNKGPKAKTREQELAEEFETFISRLEEENLGVETKRPGRTSDRPSRDYTKDGKPSKRYNTVKADEASNPAQQAAIAIAMKKDGKKPKNESAMSEKDIELQDYRSMSHKEFQTAYGMTKTEWINKNKSLVIQNPQLKQALGLEEAREEVDKWAKAMYDEIEERHGWAVAEQFEDIYWAKDVEQIEDARCNSNALRAILRTLKSIGNRDDYAEDWQRLSRVIEEYLGEGQIQEGAEQDPIVARVVKQMRPGLKNLDLSNEAFLYFAYELGKQRARDAWSDYLPAIRSAYEKGLNESADLKKQADKYTELASKANKLGDDEKCRAFQKKVADIKKKMSKLEEGWESGPDEYEEPYDDADDAYDRQRQEKIDTEAEKEWAKLPKVSTYKLTGRGPNMEPNYEFGPEFDTQEEALKYREEIMKDPKTPHPEHIGIRTITRVVNKEQTNEAIYTAPRNQEEYDAKMLALQDLQTDRNTKNDKELQNRIVIYVNNLNKLAQQKGWKIATPALESRGHTILATKLKDIERAKKFATGELKIPTPQERQAQLKQLEKEPKTAEDIVPMANPQATGSVNPVNQQKPNPQDIINATTATNTIKSATQSPAPATMIAKAIDDASQGKPVGQQDMKVLQQTMGVLKTAATVPAAGQEFKNLATKVKQIQTQKAQQQPKT